MQVEPLVTVMDVILALKQLPADAVLIIAADTEQNSFVQLRNEVQAMDAEQSATGKDTMILQAFRTISPEELEA